MNQRPARPARSRPDAASAFLALVAVLVAGSTGLRGAASEDAFRAAEALTKDGKSFEAAAAYRDALLELARDWKEDLLPEAAVGLRTLYSLSDEIGESPKDVPLLERLAAGPPAGASLAARELSAVARYYLGFSRLEAGESLEKAEADWKPLAFLSRWRVVGPFDNERGRSFLTDYGPEKELKLDARYDGKKRPVAWRSLPARPLAGRVDLTGLLEPHEEALAYAVTFVKSQAEVDVVLRLATDEGFRAWLNGVLIASRDLEREFRFDQTNVKARLQAGWNVLLLKSAQSTEDWDFSARLSGTDGAPLEGVVEGEPDPGDALPPAPRGSEPPGDDSLRGLLIEDGAVAMLQARIEARPADARAQYLLGTLLRLRRAHDAEEHPDVEALQRAIQIDPAPVAYHLSLARSQERKSEIAAQRDDNAWRRSIEKAAELGSALAYHVLAEYYQRVFGSSTRAVDLVSRALELNPAFEDAIILRGTIESALGFPKARSRALAEAFALPRRSASLLVRKGRSLLVAGRLGEAEPVLRSAFAASALGSARDSLVDLLLAKGSVDEALALERGGAALDPLSPAPLTALADHLEGQDRLEDALAALDAALKIRPEDHEILADRGRLLLRLGKRDLALESMGGALELQPNLPELREHVEFLRAARSSFEEKFRRDLTDIVKGAFDPRSAAGGNDPARVLFQLTAIDVNKDGTTKTFVQEAVQVLNDRGVRSYDVYRAPYARGEQLLEFKKARVHRPDGTTADAKLGRFGGTEGSGGFGGASVDLPPLSPKDVVEVEYVREDLAQSFFGDYFGHQEVFQESVPVDEKVLAVRVPTQRKVHFHQRNMSLEPTEVSDEASGTTTYSWTLKKLPKIEPEPAMPGAEEVSPVLEVSTFGTWIDFTRWYWNLIKNQYESSPELEKKVRELTSGADTEIQKIRSIYNFVVTDVRYNAWEFGVHGFKPYNASAIFARRFGDCKDKATLMCVMLRGAGITAYPVIINADTHRGEEDLSLPAVHHFNHCITYVPASDGRREMFLDGTAQFHSADELPSMDRGARVVIVSGEEGRIQQIPWNGPDDLSTIEEAVAVIAPDLSANLQVRVEAHGDYAVHVRDSFEIEKDRRNDLEKSYGRKHAGATVRDERFSNLKNLDEPVSFSVSVSVPRFAVEAPEGIAIEAPEDFFSAGKTLAAFGGLEKRDHDVLLGSPRRSTLKTVYRLPAGWKVRSLPPAHEVVTRFGRLEVAWREEEPGKVVGTRVIELTSPRVPVGDYAEFRELAASVSRLADEKLLLEKS